MATTFRPHPRGNLLLPIKVEMELGPLDLAGDDLKLWLDASDLSAVPNPWVDKSGSGNDLTRSGTHDLITNAQNGLNIIRTDSPITNTTTGLLPICPPGTRPG